MQLTFQKGKRLGAKLVKKASFEHRWNMTKMWQNSLDKIHDFCYVHASLWEDAKTFNHYGEEKILHKKSLMCLVLCTINCAWKCIFCRRIQVVSHRSSYPNEQWSMTALNVRCRFLKPRVSVFMNLPRSPLRIPGSGNYGSLVTYFTISRDFLKGRIYRE